MFKQILIPTDGSDLSKAAIAHGIEFAQSIDAKVIGLYVVPKYHVLTYRTEMLEETREEYALDSREHAEKYLSVVNEMAKARHVPCTTQFSINDHPYEAIIQIAEDKRCDLIVMASHGRSGVKGVLLGSQTQKVLTHSTIPVLVYR